MGPRAERPLGSGMSHRGVQAAPSGQRPRWWAEAQVVGRGPGGGQRPRRWAEAQEVGREGAHSPGAWRAGGGAWEVHRQPGPFQPMAKRHTPDVIRGHLAGGPRGAGCQSILRERLFQPLFCGLTKPSNTTPLVWRPAASFSYCD